MTEVSGRRDRQIFSEPFNQSQNCRIAVSNLIFLKFLPLESFVVASAAHTWFAAIIKKVFAEHKY